jgi:hypothetical protein
LLQNLSGRGVDAASTSWYACSGYGSVVEEEFGGKLRRKKKEG